MQEADLHKPSRQQYQQDSEPIENWREALSRAVRRSGLDREREKLQGWERRQNPPRNQQQN